VEDRPTRGVEGAHHLHRLRVDRAQSAEGGDEDREEGGEADEDHLRPDPEAEPDEEDRSHRDDRMFRAEGFEMCLEQTE